MSPRTEYLQSLECIRERCTLLLNNPQHLKHFDLDLTRLDSVVEMITTLIDRDYKSIKDIPPHSRKRHFEAGNKDRIGDLLKKLPSGLEAVRSLLDLFVVGVLLDAGAEGLAVAAYEMFLAGTFSSTKRLEADAKGLESINPEILAKAFQVSESNPLVGLQGRCSLLSRLGKVVQESCYFKGDVARPGNLLDFILNHPSTVYENNRYKVNIDVLWEIVVKGISGVWPKSRTQLDGVYLGDVWPCKALESMRQENIIPKDDDCLLAFHKLSQWLTYSLMEPLSLANIDFIGVEKMTGLAEYRNGGLFVDLQVLTLKKQYEGVPKFQVYDDEIVEWRGLTVALLDKVAELVRLKLKVSKDELELAKILEAGTWKAGREIAKAKRATMGPPIEIISDGTVF